MASELLLNLTGEKKREGEGESHTKRRQGTTAKKIRCDNLVLLLNLVNFGNSEQLRSKNQN